MDALHAVQAWLLGNDWYLYYEKFLRAYFFTGFLTLGSLLLSFKSFLINTLKKDVYDNERYQTVYYDLMDLDPDIKPDDYHRPLRRLSALLFLTMCLAFATSVTQMTIGLIPYNWATAIALLMAITTAGFIIASLRYIKINMDHWRTTLKVPADPRKKQPVT